MGLLDVGIIFPELTDGCEGGCVSRVQMVVGCSADQYPMTSMVSSQAKPYGEW